MDAYIVAAGIDGNRKGPLFRAAIGRTGQLSNRPLGRTDVWYMVRRRAADAQLETAIGCHTFRATGITDYLTNGGKLEVAQRMAGHSNAKTTGLYDRRNDDISVSEVERVGIQKPFHVAFGLHFKLLAALYDGPVSTDHVVFGCLLPLGPFTLLAGAFHGKKHPNAFGDTPAKYLYASFLYSCSLIHSF